MLSHTAVEAGICCIGLFIVYVFANVVAHVWVFGSLSESDLISLLVHLLKRN
jgi:hypothetical protein